MTILSLNECALSWDSASPEDTLRAGETLGKLLRPGDVVALMGELGSGKTVLVRGIAVGLGCAAGDVHSPSFTLINEYDSSGGDGSAAGGRTRLAHVDLYRIQSDADLPGIGWDHYCHAGHVLAVEWAERALMWLPRDHLRVRLETLEGEWRRLCVQPTGPRSGQLVRAWMASGNLSINAT
jgi:tRNA threonylcarbamoyladenosine biosynthesis protein TsaE